MNEAITRHPTTNTPNRSGQDTPTYSEKTYEFFIPYSTLMAMPVHMQPLQLINDSRCFVVPRRWKSLTSNQIHGMIENELLRVTALSSAMLTPFAPSTKPSYEGATMDVQVREIPTAKAQVPVRLAGDRLFISRPVSSVSLVSAMVPGVLVGITSRSIDPKARRKPAS